MKKLTFSFVILFFACTDAFSQAAQVAFVEIGGAGLASINYDRRFENKEDGLGGRIGIGGFSVDGASITTIPLEVNYLIGKDNRNYFELGGGITPIIVGGGFTDNGKNFTTTFGHLSFGYRMQPKDGGFFFKAAITPVFGSGYFLPYYGGLAFGYKF